MKNNFISLLFLLVIFCVAASAQSVMFQDLPADKTKLRLRFMHPSFDDVDDLSFFSGVYDLEANIPINPTWNIVISLPYSTFSREGRDTRKSFGNLYVGAQPHSHVDSTHQTIGSFGVYLPTASEEENNANYLGATTNWHELHRYLPKIMTIYGNLASIYHTSGGLFYGFELGPNIWIPTGSEEDDNRETEFFLHYGITGGTKVDKLILNAELTGLFFLSSDADSFSDKFYHSLVFDIQYAGPVQPGLFYKLYLEEELTDTVNGVLGFSLTFKTK